MPTVQISAESMALLIEQAKELDITVKDLLDSIVLWYFSEEGSEEEEESEGEEEEEEEE